MNKKHNFSDILLFVLSAELAGASSALLSGSFDSFFSRYKEPPLLPPMWLFPVVWSILYAAMGFSAYLIFSADVPDEKKSKPLALYRLQLAVNFSWSIVFFRFEALWGAFAVIVLLLVLLFLMILSFRKVRPSAAYINIPYLLWVLFAAYLNAATAIINR